MDIEGKTIWQQACGDTDRNYSNVCLEWDVILNGPGNAGPWRECEAKLEAAGWSSKKRTDLRRFSEEMAEGDLVVLRLGTRRVMAVGELVGPYDWSELFSDVDGWDLQHVRRVKWLWKGTKGFDDPHTIKMGDTTQRLTSPIVTDWLRSLSIPQSEIDRDLVQLPKVPSEDVTIDQISEYLFDRGVSSHSIETLVTEIDELVRIAKWYNKDRKNSPSESETVSYLVVPLLRALGWTPQRMAIEWHHVDIALFSSLPRSPETTSVVVEAKKKGNSCLTAKLQAESYAKDKTNCARLIVTDGLRYGVYVRSGAEFDLLAYLNLTAMRDGYPIYENCKGAKEALQAMTPEFNG